MKIKYVLIGLGIAGLSSIGNSIVFAMESPSVVQLKGEYEFRAFFPALKAMIATNGDLHPQDPQTPEAFIALCKQANIHDETIKGTFFGVTLNLRDDVTEIVLMLCNPDKITTEQKRLLQCLDHLNCVNKHKLTMDIVKTYNQICGQNSTQSDASSGPTTPTKQSTRLTATVVVPSSATASLKKELLNLKILNNNKNMFSDAYWKPLWEKGMASYEGCNLFNLMTLDHPSAPKSEKILKSINKILNKYNWNWVLIKDFGLQPGYSLYLVSLNNEDLSEYYAPFPKNLGAQVGITPKKTSIPPIKKSTPTKQTSTLPAPQSAQIHQSIVEKLQLINMTQQDFMRQIHFDKQHNPTNSDSIDEFVKNGISDVQAEEWFTKDKNDLFTKLLVRLGYLKPRINLPQSITDRLSEYKTYFPEEINYMSVFGYDQYIETSLNYLPQQGSKKASLKQKELAAVMKRAFTNNGITKEYDSLRQEEEALKLSKKQPTPAKKTSTPPVPPKKEPAPAKSTSTPPKNNGNKKNNLPVDDKNKNGGPEPITKDQQSTPAKKTSTPPEPPKQEPKPAKPSTLPKEKDDSGNQKNAPVDDKKQNGAQKPIVEDKPQQPHNDQPTTQATNRSLYAALAVGSVVVGTGIIGAAIYKLSNYMSAAKIKTQRATINQLLKKAESHDAEIDSAYRIAQPKLSLLSKQVHAQIQKHVDAKDYAALSTVLKAEHKRFSVLLNKNIVLRMALGFKHLIGMS